MTDDDQPKALMGTPPRFDGKHDFTVTAVELGSVSVRWQTQSAGFGEFYFYVKPGTLDKYVIADERMGKDFIKAVLNKLVDDAELEER